MPGNQLMGPWLPVTALFGSDNVLKCLKPPSFWGDAVEAVGIQQDVYMARADSQDRVLVDDNVDAMLRVNLALEAERNEGTLVLGPCKETYIAGGELRYKLIRRMKCRLMVAFSDVLNILENPHADCTANRGSVFLEPTFRYYVRAFLGN